MHTRGERVWAAICEHPWAILEERLTTICAVVERVMLEAAEGRRPAVREPITPEAARGATAAPSGVAVIPVSGILTHRANLFSDFSGGTSTEQLAKAIRQAAADPAITAIVLDVDSPGGSVFGVEEAAEVIYEARASKKVVAVANAWAASAAYWLASQASELVMTPSGQVGSVGVLAVHDDVSKAAEMVGLKRTFIHAGRYKIEGNEFEPLADPARAHVQAQVDAYMDTFVKAVARGRGVAQKTVRETFGEGRMLLAAPALAAGMVDRIETLEQTLGRLTGRSAAKAAVAEASPPDAEPVAPVVTPAAECPGPDPETDRRRRRLALLEKA